MQHVPSFQVVEGQLQGARQVPSPNFNARPTDQEIQLLVIHNINCLPPVTIRWRLYCAIFSE